MTPEEALRVTVELAQGVQAAAQGDTLGAARHAISALFEAVPDAEEARKLIDEEAVRRANRIADAIEDARFGDEKG